MKTLYKVMQWNRYGNVPPRVLDIVEELEEAQYLVDRFDEYYSEAYHTVRDIEWFS